MKTWIFSIMWQEEKMIPWFLRNYSWADKIVVWLEPSNDNSAKLLKSCSKVDLRPWPHRGLDDNRFTEAVNKWGQEARGKADWICWVDCDELLHHPNILSVLEKANGDIFPSTGYALISQNGWPDPKLPGQLYDYVKTGVPQDNYSKMLLHRPSLNVIQAIGRHVYPGHFPKHDGRVCSDAGIKLLHCHCLGGVESTAERNRRNYARVLNKQHAWNFSEPHNSNPKQSGSVAWVADAIQNNKLIDVFTGDPMVDKTTLKKVQFGSNSNKLTGWENYDVDVDITKPLPFKDGSCSHLYAEHCLEHISHQEAWNFFTECHRILAKGGRLRIAIPDFTKLERDMIPEYQSAVKAGGHGDGSKLAALKAVIFEHGHKSAWNSALLFSFLKAIGFSVTKPAYGESTDPVLVNVEQHWKIVTKPVAENETSIVEGQKL